MDYTHRREVVAGMKKSMKSVDNTPGERVEREKGVTYPSLSPTDPGQPIVFADAFPRPEGRATITRHVHRGGTPTAHDRVLATQFGHRAVQLIVQGELNRMVCMQNGRLSSVPISEVADQQRLVTIDHPLLEACRAVGVSFGD